MPKLIIIDQAQPADLPNASTAAFGADVGRAMQDTGNVTKALGLVVQQYGETSGRTAAIKYEQELQAAAKNIALEPDITKRGRMFDKAQASLLAKHSPGMLGRGTYESRSGMATSEIRMNLDHQSTLDGIQASRDGTDLELQHFTTKAANAGSEEEAESYIAQGTEALAAAHLFYTAPQRAVLAQAALASTIGLMAEKNPEMAKRFFDKSGHMLPPETQVSLSNSIDSESRYREAQSVSDLARDTLGGSASLSDRLKFVRDRLSGPARNDAESRVRVQFNDDEALRNDAKTQQVDAVWDAIYAGAGLDAIPRGLKHSDEGPMRHYVEARSAAAAKGEEFNPKTDDTTWSMLWNIRTKDKETFKGLNLPAYRLMLSGEHYNQLKTEQKSLLSGEDGLEDSPSGIGALEYARKVAADSGHAVPTEMQPTFDLAVDRAIREAQRVKGSKLTGSEKREAAVRALEQLEVPNAGFLWQGKLKPAAEWTLDDRESFIERTPASVLQLMADRLMAKGVIYPTQDELDDEKHRFLDSYGVKR